MSNDFKTLLEQGISRHLKKATIEDRERILLILDTSFPWISDFENFFVNVLMFESVSLIKNSVIQFEEGFFDAAMYSLRQSIENMNNSLFLIENKTMIQTWKGKERFPQNAKVLKELEEKVENFKEIKSVLSVWFNKYEESSMVANKYIHKQGFDTFYDAYKDEQKTFEKVNAFYNRYLKYTIAQLYIMYIAIHPLVLIVSDSELHLYMHMNLMEDKIPIDFLNDVIGEDEFNKIKTTNVFLSLKEYFEKYEKLNYPTENLLKEQYINYEYLSDINNQKHLLGEMERILFEIAFSGISFSYGFFSDLFILPFFTSIKPSYQISYFSSDMFSGCLDTANVNWNGLYYNSFKNKNGRCLVLLTNDPLSSNELTAIQKIINEYSH